MFVTNKKYVPLMLISVLVIAIVISVIIFVSTRSEENREEFHGWGGWGRRRRWGGWGGWGRRGWMTSWPPYLYGYPSYYSSPRPKCISSNEGSDCEPAFPVKVGLDINNDGVKDTWQCCRRY